ncbi:MAG: hypothetical protein GY862_24745, partial [Gammaproteobacteria bacterium]|nr:hypothetical protein [Gammaproteobacteria bacterium]
MTSPIPKKHIRRLFWSILGVLLLFFPAAIWLLVVTKQHNLLLNKELISIVGLFIALFGITLWSTLKKTLLTPIKLEQE